MISVMAPALVTRTKRPVKSWRVVWMGHRGLDSSSCSPGPSGLLRSPHICPCILDEADGYAIQSVMGAISVIICLYDAARQKPSKIIKACSACLERSFRNLTLLPCPRSEIRIFLQVIVFGSHSFHSLHILCDIRGPLHHGHLHFKSSTCP